MATHTYRCDGPCGENYPRSRLQNCPCRFAKYCGRECQKAHWPIHKKICVSRVPVSTAVSSQPQSETKMSLTGDHKSEPEKKKDEDEEEEEKKRIEANRRVCARMTRNVRRCGLSLATLKHHYMNGEKVVLQYVGSNDNPPADRLVEMMRQAFCHLEVKTAQLVIIAAHKESIPPEEPEMQAAWIPASPLKSGAIELELRSWIDKRGFSVAQTMSIELKT